MQVPFRNLQLVNMVWSLLEGIYLRVCNTILWLCVKHLIASLATITHCIFFSISHCNGTGPYTLSSLEVFVAEGLSSNHLVSSCSSNVFVCKLNSGCFMLRNLLDIDHICPVGYRSKLVWLDSNDKISLWPKW